MGFMEIISIIMSILQLIAGLFAPKTTSYVRLADYDCDRVEWVGAPAVVGGEFVGTAEVRCSFEGVAGGSIAVLRSHMAEQLPKDGNIQGETRVATYQGLPSLSFRTHLDMGQATAYGVTNIASDGARTLRNIFESDSIVADGVGKYLKHVYAETHVAGNGTEEYDLKMVQTIRVQKPAGISSAKFKSRLMDEAEGALADRAAAAVQEMASWL